MSDVRTLIALAETMPPAPEEPVPLMPPRPEGAFEVESLETADWALEVLGESETRKSQNKRIAAAAHARVDAWLERMTALEDSGTAYVRASLLQWMSRSRTEILGAKSKKKSRELTNGTIGWKSSASKYLWEDEDATLAWAKAQPVEAGFYRVKYEIEKDAVKRHVQATGEVPPGLKVTPGDEEMFVKPSTLALVKGE